MVINRVGPLAAAKVVGLLYAIVGLGMGAIFSLVSALRGFSPGRGDAGPLFFGAAAVVFFPVAYGVVGFVMTLIITWLYNALARLVGGIEVDLR